MNNEHIERHNQEIRKAAFAELIPLVTKLSLLVLGTEQPLRVESPEPPVKKKVSVRRSKLQRTRRPTVATEAQIDDVHDAVFAYGSGLTVRQIKNTTKIGQTTVAAACAVLVERGLFRRKQGGVFEQAVSLPHTEPIENGAASEGEEVDHTKW